MDSLGARLARGAVLFSLALLGAAALQAQHPAGEIRILGHRSVRRADGSLGKAAEPGQPESIGVFRQTRRARTLLRSFPYGRYRLEVSKDGFATQSMLIDVQSATPVSRTVTMALATQASRIDVVAATPLPGTDLPLDQIPAPVQTASARDLEQSGALDLSDLLNQRLSGVHINQNQENPYQPDVNYRGYTASPLLGTPEGHLGLHGRRPAEPAVRRYRGLGPDSQDRHLGSRADAGIESAVRAQHPGRRDLDRDQGRPQRSPALRSQVSGGSFGRRAGEFEHGGSNSNGLSWYVAGNLFREDGWRQFSPSEVRQSFGKLGWQHGKTSICLSFAYADNWLTGNGLQDYRFLAAELFQRLQHSGYHLEPLALVQPERCGTTRPAI